MALYDRPRDPQLCELTLAAVHAANTRVKALEDENRYIGSYFNFPHFRRFDNGFPNISDIGSNPINYREAFALRPGEFTRIAYRDVPELAAVIDYVLAQPDLRARIVGDTPGGSALSADDDYAEIGAAFLPLKILDRARHLNGADPVPTLLQELYLEREAPIFEEQLPVEIVVPIILTRFTEEDRIEIAPSIFLEEMDEPTQLARCYDRSIGYKNVHRVVVEAATHAFVFTDYHVNRSYAWFCNRLTYFTTDRIDTVFTALELVSDVPTGYAQILLRPLGWADDWKADLPPLSSGVTVRRYPPAFEDGGWLRETEAIPVELLSRFGTAFQRLNVANKAVQLAARRLNSAMLRDRDDDMLIDLCIGLEALFGDRQGEIVHKLALRVAAMTALADPTIPLTPPDAFRAMKQIYDYRSRLVHGDVGPERRVFTSETGVEHDKVALATTFLRGALAALLQHPEFLQPGAIEEKLLSWRLDG